MTDIRRTLRCASCGFESSISLSSDFELHDLMAMGRCKRCNSAMQINYSLLPSQGQSQPQSPGSSTDHPSTDSPSDLADSIFSSESTSDTIKDLMGD